MNNRTAKVTSDEILISTTVRIPKSIHEWLREEAEKNHRSLNAHIVYMAEQAQQGKCTRSN